MKATLTFTTEGDGDWALLLTLCTALSRSQPYTAAPDWATALIEPIARMETKLTQASDDIAQLRGDVSALTTAFTGYQAKVQADVAAANAKAADLQAKLDAMTATAAAATAADPEAIPPDVQAALDEAHMASQALLSSMTGLTATAAAPNSTTSGAATVTGSTEQPPSEEQPPSQEQPQT